MLDPISFLPGAEEIILVEFRHKHQSFNHLTAL